MKITTLDIKRNPCGIYYSFYTDPSPVKPRDVLLFSGESELKDILVDKPVNFKEELFSDIPGVSFGYYPTYRVFLEYDPGDSSNSQISKRSALRKILDKEGFIEVTPKMNLDYYVRREVKFLPDDGDLFSSLEPEGYQMLVEESLKTAPMSRRIRFNGIDNLFLKELSGEKYRSDEYVAFISGGIERLGIGVGYQGKHQSWLFEFPSHFQGAVVDLMKLYL